MKRFYGSKCFPNQDPNQYVINLEEFQDKICDLSENKEEILDVSFISHIIGSLPEKYHSEGLLLSQMLYDTSGKGITIKKMQSMLNVWFIELKGQKCTDFERQDKAALVGFGQFKGKCHHCGKIGHKAVDCLDRKPKAKNPKEEKAQVKFKEKMKCFNCKKPGHWKKDCFAWKKAQDGAIVAMKEDVALAAWQELEAKILSRLCSRNPLKQDRKKSSGVKNEFQDSLKTVKTRTLSTMVLLIVEMINL